MTDSTLLNELNYSALGKRAKSIWTTILELHPEWTIRDFRLNKDNIKQIRGCGVATIKELTRFVDYHTSIVDPQSGDEIVEKFKQDIEKIKKKHIGLKLELTAEMTSLISFLMIQAGISDCDCDTPCSCLAIEEAYVSVHDITIKTSRNLYHLKAKNKPNLSYLNSKGKAYDLNFYIDHIIKFSTSASNKSS